MDKISDDKILNMAMGKMVIDNLDLFKDAVMDESLRIENLMPIVIKKCNEKFKKRQNIIKYLRINKGYRQKGKLNN